MAETLILGDCLEKMRGIEDGSVDLVLTDPPYGIASVWKGGSGSGWGKARADTEKRNKWDVAPSQEYFDEMLRVGKTICIWGGNYFNLPISRGWLVWVKPERNFSLSEAELAWTNRDTVMRVFDGKRSDSQRWHPTQKPILLMQWCVEKLSEEGDTVLDPFMGSGTTGVACIHTRRNFIGIEKDETYFKIASERIKGAQLPLL